MSVEKEKFKITYQIEGCDEVFETEPYDTHEIAEYHYFDIKSYDRVQ
jgi:hypothetical protein